MMWVVEAAAPSSRTWAPVLDVGRVDAFLTEQEAAVVVARMSERHPRWRYRTVQYEAVEA